MTSEERINLADRIIALILEQLDLEWRGDVDCDIWLEEKEHKPDLRVV